MIRKTNKFSIKNTIIHYHLHQQCVAKYLIIVVNRGMASEINYCNSLKEAKRIFVKIAHVYRYEPEEINGSDYYDVSIWEWKDGRYENTHMYI